ncbi:LacI family transcriptional regulator [Polaribacter vadi]|jgi:DNA-binding LacI/PurR family transcriptional regulator|uniref:LacI family transcriptional regulator n=1 Tax=Polaribacter vadi TaxID=1774273 RepID=A0A1B8TTY2_9FLAO|nr:LacI family DNA-binding transcriptional regulator [Polaribacter vadi]AOW19111.1 LacI family transcriptional regulator [Polaribacter vadi]OBY63161.1 LacI family transcriptional regulator [Polaribacter vadi]|tara:strand:+ start:173 stop:1204 length:1032 start_codon:yes stop_codon:yes gene_type:complete
MKKYTEITIYDIAEKLNLATSTISRALKDHRSISEKTIKKVKKTAFEMGYQPNNLAASLRNKQTKTIGVLLPTVTQPFLSSLISGIEITAKKAGYTVMIMQSHDSYDEEVNLAQSLYNNRVSGIICSLAMETQDTSHFQIFINNNTPLVFVDRVPKNFNTYRVVIDNFSAGYKATKHLIDQGCKRIAHLSVGSEFGNLYSERKKGYLEALKDHNIDIDEQLIVRLTTVTYDEAEKGTNKLLDLKNPPDGIFTPGDILGVSALQCAKKRGIKVPEELAIIGFNNDPISEIIDPNLSTITHPAEKMGQAAAKIIIKNLKSLKKDDIKEITFLNTEVLVRESSKKK